MPSSNETEPEVKELSESIMIKSLKGYSDPYALHRLLYLSKPQFIIMYDCDMTFVRQVNSRSFNFI